MSNPRGPVTLLDGVTATGPGPTIDLGGPADTFSVIGWVTGGSSGSSYVSLQGSQDGTHWITIANSMISPDNSAPQGARTSNPTVSVRYIRGNVPSIISGASVSATVIPE